MVEKAEMPTRLRRTIVRLGDADDGEVGRHVKEDLESHARSLPTTPRKVGVWHDTMGMMVRSGNMKLGRRRRDSIREA